MFGSSKSFIQYKQWRYRIYSPNHIGFNWGKYDNDNRMYWRPFHLGSKLKHKLLNLSWWCSHLGRFYIFQFRHHRQALKHTFYHISTIIYSIGFPLDTKHIDEFLYRSGHLRDRFLSTSVIFHLVMYLQGKQYDNLDWPDQFLYLQGIFCMSMLLHHRLYQHRI